MGLEARTREQSRISNLAGRVLLIAKPIGRDAATRRPYLIICPVPAATDFLPHRLRVAIAGKEEFRGVYPPDNTER
jgi:hypothetical protein